MSAQDVVAPGTELTLGLNLSTSVEIPAGSGVTWYVAGLWWFKDSVLDPSHLRESTYPVSPKDAGRSIFAVASLISTTVHCAGAEPRVAYSPAVTVAKNVATLVSPKKVRRAAGKAIRMPVSVSAGTDVVAEGEVLVKRGAKVLGGVSLKSGQGRLVIPRGVLPQGKHKLALAFLSATDTVADATGSVTVWVR
ncbi:hypothetical protein [Nocardioides sp.]|uniref:hypothetical protein n=1 Tax=Nocardioides sp. TaxID=35761 RepID=UPI0039E3111F